MEPSSKRFFTFFDAQGLVAGTLLCALGLVFLEGAGLVSGQLAGASLLLSYVAPVEFGTVFFAVSAPMFILAWARRGRIFTLRSLCVVAGIAVVTPFLGRMISFETINPIAAALLGGLCVGMGLIAVFRHDASPGGSSILAIVIEDWTGFKAGWFQMGVDSVIFAAAMLVLTPAQVALSFLGALVMNMLVAWNFNIQQAGRGAPTS